VSSPAGQGAEGLEEAMINRDYALEEFFRTEMVGDREVLIGLAEGDIPNGDRVVKTNSEPGDGHQDGTMGTVVGALEADVEVRAKLRKQGLKQVRWMYWVKFDDLPEVPVAIADFRIEGC